mmetsp:Transcript_44392/g.52012  ORF Transcript_44392/g.52012 Transcript_44392/m.52012 type:complete len:110 (-) Transcript_44392:92-421(-)
MIITKGTNLLILPRSRGQELVDNAPPLLCFRSNTYTCSCTELKILTANYDFEIILGIPPPFDEHTSHNAGTVVLLLVRSNWTIQLITRAASNIEIKKSFERGSEYGDER